jgi:hypothetical protein
VNAQADGGADDGGFGQGGVDAAVFGPNSFIRPAVTRKTPSSWPTSWPRTITRRSSRIASAIAWFSALTIVICGMACSLG